MGNGCPWQNNQQVEEDCSDESSSDGKQEEISEEAYANQLVTDEDYCLDQWYAGMCLIRSMTHQTNITCKLTKIKFLVDTGATASFLPERLCEKRGFQLLDIPKPVSL